MICSCMLAPVSFLLQFAASLFCSSSSLVKLHSALTQPAATHPNTFSLLQIPTSVTSRVCIFYRGPASSLSSSRGGGRRAAGRGS